MRHPWKLPLVVVCLLALAFLPLFPAPRGSAQSATYTATDVGTLGGAQSVGLGIDGCGKVVGESFPTGSTLNHPFIWDKGSITDIGTFGGPSGTASGVTNAGAVSGSAHSGTGEMRPFLWTAAGGKIDIAVVPPPPNNGTAAAYDINESNQIVGQWETSPLQDRAFLWTQATGFRFVTATWGTPIAAYGINNAGDIVGTAETPAGEAHAFFRSGGVTTEIGTLGGPNSFAHEVNETGVVVGYANIASSGASRPFHAFRWTSAGGIVDLGTLGGTHSIAHGVNASGQVVGYAQVAGGAQHAFLWTDDNSNGLHDAGEMKDLNTLAPVAGWTFDEARGINDRGQIVATAVNGTGQRHAFLLTPDNAGPSPCAVPGSLQFDSATYAAGEGTTANITVTRTGGADGAVSVSYATSNGTATAGDYTAAGGTLNFADGETSKTFNVPLAEDALDETNETVNLTLSSPSGGAGLGSQSTAVLTINDNDEPPTLSVGDVTVTEGNAGTVNAVFTVTLAAASGQTVTVNYATADNSAVAPGDYTTITSTQLTFNPGETSKNVTVLVAGDTTDEPNETFFVNLSGASNASISDAQGVGTITDDDGAPSLSIGDVTVTEGNAGTTAATFTVTLLPASGQAVSVNYATADGTATTANSDYVAKSGTLNFGIGETSKTITVNVNGDTTPESHENFFVNLSGESNATVSDVQGQGTVNNDDTALSINDLSIAEGNSGSTTFNFTVGLSHPSVNAVSVNYATSDGTATTASGDYSAASGLLNFAAGETSKNVSVTVNGDALFEGNETFNVTLSSASGATIFDGTGVGTITNDDTAPSFSVNDVTVTEGNTGTINAVFTVTLSAPSALASSVVYATGNASANTTNNDYTAASGTLNFAAGETTKNVSVSVNGDTLFEMDETFTLNLSSPSGAGIADAQGAGTIANDDPMPTISVNDVTVNEGTITNVNATFTVTLSNPSSQNITVNYATSDGTAKGSPAGSDYGSTSGTLTFASGETQKTVVVSVLFDGLDEANETFFVNLSGVLGGATIADGTGVGTINDGDTAPSLSVGDTTAAEGDGLANFTFTLSAASGQNVIVNYVSSDGTAIAGADYMGVGSSSVTFSPGETTKTVTVSILNDTTDEPDETFNLTIRNAANAFISDGTGVGTITDDDAAPTISVGDAAAVLEGNTGTTNATFAVTLSAASGKTVSVNYATSDDTANAGSDYTAANGTLTFSPGETSKNVTVAVVGDTTDETNETFNVNLSGATNATINDGTGVGSITDDDGAPSLSIGDVIVTEGNSGGSGIGFTVTLAPASGQTVTVNYATADGTAKTDGADYVATSGTITFAPGETTKTFLVFVLADTLNEPDENFFVNLSAASNAAIADAQAVGTILNDDTPTLRFAQASYPANESAHFVNVNVTRSGDTSGAVNVDFATSDGTATERKDYTAVSGTLRFAAGETSRSFDVLLTEDAFEESAETINLTLSNPTGGAALGAQATATVVLAADDDPPPAGNPIDNSSDFVRQHYHDFLNREPDAGGLAFWTGEIEQCGADAGCREVKRINVSAAFFLSIEFQETGYLVYRTYKAAYGDATSPGVPGTVPVVRINEFLPDTRRIGEGVVVGPDGWQQLLDANKNAYMMEFVQRQRFITAYPLTQTPAQFVDALFSNAGVTPSAAERQAAIDEFGNAATSADAAPRGRALRRVAEHPSLVQAELRRAFVLMQYFGYLRRNPDASPEPGLNFGGWNFWLGKLNEHNGNYVQAEMVKAFLDASEYRNRFGQ